MKITREPAGENPLLLLSSNGVKEPEHLADFLKSSYGVSGKHFLKITDMPATTAGLGDNLAAGHILGVT